MTEKHKILLVDDEARVLSAISRQLVEKGDYEIFASLNGMDGLLQLEKNKGISVIVSDFHMPNMDGITFLAETQRRFPDISRVMLTGAADLDMAIDAVNRGRIFRFLIKPCPAEVLLSAIKASIYQYQLITSERELLGKTLGGTVKLLVDILSALNPDIFAQVSRVRAMCREFAKILNLENQWEVEISALFCRIGVVTIPTDILTKWRLSIPLSASEQDMIDAIPKIGQDLIANIPRLENISQYIGMQNLTFMNIVDFDAPISGKEIPIVARILKVAIDYDTFLLKSSFPKKALMEMRSQNYEYDPELLAILQDKILDVKTDPHDFHASNAWFQPSGLAQEQNLDGKALDVVDISPGMMLLRDVYGKNGSLIVSKGTVITDLIRVRLVNYFRSHAIFEPVIVSNEKWIN